MTAAERKLLDTIITHIVGPKVDELNSKIEFLEKENERLRSQNDKMFSVVIDHIKNEANELPRIKQES